MEEKLKNSWRDTRLHTPDTADTDSIMTGRRLTALENLARRYQRFFTLGLAMALLWSPTFLGASIFPQEWRLILCIYSMVYFLTAVMMDVWLYRGIKSIDCATMAVSEVAARALLYRKRHLQFMIVLIPMAIVFLGMMVAMFAGDGYLVYSVVAGAVLGIIIGTMQFRRFMADYRELRY